MHEKDEITVGASHLCEEEERGGRKHSRVNVNLRRIRQPTELLELLWKLRASASAGIGKVEGDEELTKLDASSPHFEAIV